MFKKKKKNHFTGYMNPFGKKKKKKAGGGGDGMGHKLAYFEYTGISFMFFLKTSSLWERPSLWDA